MTAAELLSIAAFMEGKYAQAFPSFGSERMGAPVVAFCRIDDRPIRTREPVMQPDALVIQDPTLFSSVDVLQGISSDGYLLINSSRSYAALGIDAFVAGFPAGHVRTVAATELALALTGRPIPNATLLGAFAAMTDVIGLESVCAALRERFTGRVAELNIAAATAAFDAVTGAETKEIAAC